MFIPSVLLTPSLLWGLLDTWAHLSVNKNSDVKRYLKGWRRKQRREKKNQGCSPYVTLSLLFEPVPGTSVLPHGLRGKGPNVQRGFQGLSDLAYCSPCLHTSAQAAAPARIPAVSPFTHQTKHTPK